MSAYITGAGKFLPGSPIPSERIEEYIGSVGANSSRLRDRVIANSGIAQRHYAIDTEQRSRHSCASMAAEAIRAAVADAGRALDDIELLAVATTINDVLAPGVASMVHGELANAPCEIASLGGICASGMMAMKNAFLQVKTGEKALAVAAATEFASRIMKSSRFVGQPHLDADGQVAREIAFLRYMLSDGAGAVVVADRPRPDGVSLRIDWISLRSFANRTPAVMYCGTPDTAIRAAGSTTRPARAPRPTEPSRCASTCRSCRGCWRSSPRSTSGCGAPEASTRRASSGSSPTTPARSSSPQGCASSTGAGSSCRRRARGTPTCATPATSAAPRST